MPDTQFADVRYRLGALIDNIELGETALPDIQRPYVWQTVKVKELFDSLYQGYPVGYFLFWETSDAIKARNIGVEGKQHAPRRLVVDGQQRLTSLYAIFKGVEVIDNEYKVRDMKIAFNPLEEKFEVSNSTLQRDARYISNITEIFQSPNIHSLTTDFLERLSDVYEKSGSLLTTEQKNIISNSIAKVKGLEDFPFSALELSSNLDESSIAEIFVRINSKGASLQSTDFILTLMSVYWEEGRKELEEFCRGAVEQNEEQTSAFNHFIKPEPGDLLRVSIMVAFKRARMQEMYSILRGKDFGTDQFDLSQQESQFETLKKGQQTALNLTNWHDFMKCLQQAGYRTEAMVTSNFNLICCYVLYLIGRTECGITDYNLRPVISKFFFMCCLTGRYTGSAEGQIVRDLIILGDTTKVEDTTKGSKFLGILEEFCKTALPDDFWKVTLPNNLTSSGGFGSSPALSAFTASLILLDAPVLYSQMKVNELIDPSLNPTRNAVERHHLFPSAYLRKEGLAKEGKEGTFNTNQIANMAWVEWGDNAEISDKSPKEYVEEMEKRFDSKTLEEMYAAHALPKNWQDFGYSDFLKARRLLISDVIKQGYEILEEKVVGREEIDASTKIAELVSVGESRFIEFKSTMRVALGSFAEDKRDSRMEYAVQRTIAGFLNTSGGTLVIGISDDGAPIGLEHDGFKSDDAMLLHLTNLINNGLGRAAHLYIHSFFTEYLGVQVLQVVCGKSDSPIYLKDGKGETAEERFYIRGQADSMELKGAEALTHISNRFPRVS